MFESMCENLLTEEKRISLCTINQKNVELLSRKAVLEILWRKETGQYV